MTRRPPSVLRSIAKAACLAGTVAGAGAWGQTTSPQNGTTPTEADGPVYTLKASTRIAVVDVTAVDAKGQPVHNLPRGAFTVLEDGKPQAIQSFLEVGREAPPAMRVPPKLPPNIHTNLQPAPTTSAVNVLLLDSLNTAPADQAFVRQETVKYLKSMAPGTRIAILGLSSQLRLLQGFTTDPAILIAAIHSKKNRALPSPYADTTEDFDATADTIADADASAAFAEFQSQQASFQNDVRTRVTLEALNQIAAYLSGIKGRKNLIWFTGGMPLSLFPQGGTNDLETITDYTKEIRKTTDLMTAGQIAIYPVDAKGLVVNPGASVVNPPRGFANGRGDAMAQSTLAFTQKNANEHLGMDAIADATGGIAFFNTNGLKQAVNEAVQNGQNYYTLSYLPPKAEFDGAYHRITVKTTQPGVSLSYRKGYYADDLANNAIKPGVSLATTAPVPYGSNMAASMGRGVPTSSQILFSVRVDPQDPSAPRTSGEAPERKVLGVLDPRLQGKTLRRYDLHYSLPGRQITFNPAAGGMHKGSLQFEIAAYDVDGKVITSLSQTIDLSLTDERFKALQTKPFQLTQAIDLPVGEVFLRVGILDAVSDKTGTLELPLAVKKGTPSAPPAAAQPAAVPPAGPAAPLNSP